jgi:hypothetical protein
MTQLLCSTLFGPEYDDATVQNIAEVACESGKSIEITYLTEFQTRSPLLPPGGYIIKYISGSFLLLKMNPATSVVGGPDGLQVAWKSSLAHKWTSVAFMEAHLPTADKLFYLEFTGSHRLRLTPPADAVGTVKLRVLRCVPRMLETR